MVSRRYFLATPHKFIDRVNTLVIKKRFSRVLNWFWFANCLTSSGSSSKIWRRFWLKVVQHMSIGVADHGSRRIRYGTIVQPTIKMWEFLQLNLISQKIGEGESCPPCVTPRQRLFHFPAVPCLVCPIVGQYSIVLVCLRDLNSLRFCFRLASRIT